MDDILKEIDSALKKLADSVKKDLADVIAEKEKVQALSEEIHHTVKNGKYLRDEERIIISAPEIILGNLDHNGNLLGGGGGSAVIVRGNNVSLEGVGPVGSIIQRAPSIKSIAVDPTSDGMHSVLGGVSEIVSQARSVTLMSQDDSGCFVKRPTATSTGINLLSDTTVSINATPENKVLTAEIEAQLSEISKSSSKLQKSGETLKKNISTSLANIEKLIKDQDDYNSTNEDICFNYNDVDKLNEQFLSEEMALCSTIADYIDNITMQAEMNRREKALKAKKSKLSSKSSTFAKNPTGSHVSIASETITMACVDGDGNIRENKESAVLVQAPHFDVIAHDKDGKLIKDSSASLNYQNIELATYNQKLEKMKKGDILAEGDVKITTKTMEIAAVDSKTEDGKKIEEKALTKGGTLNVRFENVIVSNTDTEGKSTGKLALNAKTMNIAAMDVDKEKRTDKEMAAGSKLTILAEKNYVGTTKKTKLIQLASEKVGIMGKDTAEMQQDGKAVLTLNGGNVTTGGSKVEIKGDTTIEGGADIKGEAKAPKVTAQQGEFSAAFKSPTINDTMGAGVPAPAGKPSAKMTEEEAKTT